MFAFMRAVRSSDLPAPAKNLLMTLGSLADTETIVIPEKFSPSLTELARMTSLGRSTVAEQLGKVEDLGWVKRAQPSIEDARKNKARTQYYLLIPGSPAPGLVHEADQPDQGKSDTSSPGAGPG